MIYGIQSDRRRPRSGDKDPAEEKGWEDTASFRYF